MKGQHTGTHVRPDPQLVGESAEVSVIVNGKETVALCDTGSCVSTCSQSFYNENLRHVQLQPVCHILKIECADGNELPYSGFVEVSVRTSARRSKFYGTSGFIADSFRYQP